MPVSTLERASEPTSTMHIRVKDDVRIRARQNADRMGIPLTALVNAFLIKLAYDGVVPFELSVPDEEPNESVYEAYRELKDGGGVRVASVDEMYRSIGLERE